MNEDITRKEVTKSFSNGPIASRAEGKHCHSRRRNDYRSREPYQLVCSAFVGIEFIFQAFSKRCSNRSKRLVNLLKALVNLLKTLVNLLKTLVDLLKTLVNLLQSVGRHLL